MNAPQGLSQTVPKHRIQVLQTPSPASCSLGSGTNWAIGAGVFFLIVILFSSWWFWPTGSNSCSGSGCSGSGCSGSGCTCSSGSSPDKPPAPAPASGISRDATRGRPAPVSDRSAGNPEMVVPHEVTYGATLAVDSAYGLTDATRTAINTARTSHQDRWSATSTPELGNETQLPLGVDEDGPSLPPGGVSAGASAGVAPPSGGIPRSASGVVAVPPNAQPNTIAHALNATRQNNAAVALVSSGCPHCVNLRNAAMASTGPFKDVYLVDATAHAGAVMSAIGKSPEGVRVPTVIVNGTPHVGFDSRRGLEQYA